MAWRREYDTLDEYPAVRSPEQLYCALFGPIYMPKQKFCGVMIIGDAAKEEAGFWGRAVVFHEGIGLRGGNELLQVRCAPKGSFGQPLQPGELRSIVFRITHLARSTAHVTAIRLWACVGHAQRVVEACTAANGDTVRPTKSIGARLSHLPIALFHAQSRPRAPRAGAEQHFPLFDRQGFHLLLASSVTRESRCGTQVGASTSDAVLYSALSGVQFTEARDRPRAAIEILNASAYDARATAVSIALTAGCGAEEAQDVTFATRRLMQHASLVGAVDWLSEANHPDGICYGGIPTDFQHPLCLPLVIAVCVRLACCPRRYSMTHLFNEDAACVNEFATLLEQSWPPISSNAERKESEDYAIDCIMKVAYDNASQQCSGRAAAGRDLWCRVLENMQLMFRIGTAVVRDVWDVGDEADFANFSPFGLADTVHDGVAAARSAAAWRFSYTSADQVAKHNFGARHSRTERLSTLVQLLHHVDRVLRTGNARGETPARESAPADPLDLGELMEAQMHEQSVAQASACTAACFLFGMREIANFDFSTHVVSLFAAHACVDCSNPVTLIEGLAFHTRLNFCPSCYKRRCFCCSDRMARFYADGASTLCSACAQRG